MIEDSGAGLLLTHHASPAVDAVSSRPLRVLFLDGEPDRPPDSLGGAGGRHGPDQAAYVIYTSGSTGRPKGVVAVAPGSRISPGHGGPSRVRPGDRFLEFPSFSFDAARVSIGATLAAGGMLVLRPAGYRALDRRADGLLTAQGVTLFDLPVAFWREGSPSWPPLPSPGGRSAARRCGPSSPAARACRRRP